MIAPPRTLEAQRRELLRDLLIQLPRTRGSLRRQTERSIAQLEGEIAPGRAVEREVVNSR